MKAVSDAALNEKRLVDVIPANYQAATLGAARKWSEQYVEAEKKEKSMPAVKVTSYEGSKGMSAQYVFLLGLHSGEIPRKAAEVQDIEICRLVVGITRTKKKCSILTAKNFGGKWKEPSEFLSWINDRRLNRIEVSKSFFTN